jgi:transcriptional regulator with XRE-family HTH domain
MPTKRNPDRLEWRVRSAADLGRALAGARRQRGLTQEQMARELQIDRSYLSELESGSSALVLQRTLRALRRLDAEVTVTLRRDEDPPLSY